MYTIFLDALSSAAIGLLSVFLALLSVYASGMVLIRVANALSAPEQKEKMPKRNNLANISKIPNKEIAVLSATVDLITDGKGRISKIQKLEK